MIFGGFERMVAFRYLRARRQEGFISVIAIFSLLGIALGVATLIVVMSVMNGFRADLVSNIIGINGHLTVRGSGATIGGFDDLDAKIREVPGVVGVRPLVEGQALASTDRGSTGVLVRGLRADDIAAQPLLASGTTGLALDEFSDDTVILGWRLLANLGLRVGDGVTLAAPSGSMSGLNSAPRIESYRIVGTLNIGMPQYDSNLILMPLSAAQRFFQTGDDVSALEIYSGDPDHLDEQRRAIAGIVGLGARIEDWQQSNATFMNAIEIERSVMFLILTLIILVAAFNIVSGMTMLVTDKGRDIAILRTMGATRVMVLRIFVLAGASIGFVGTFAGFILGVEFATHIAAIRMFFEDYLHVEFLNAELDLFTRVPAQVHASDVAFVLAMAFGLSFLATLYPAWRATRLDPVEALRYE
jgi:lipoprotein-releasing system permease protein